MLVVDASAMVELLLRSDLGTRIEAELAPEDLVAPELLDAEVLHAFRSLEQRGTISADRVERALDVLAHTEIERVSHTGLVADAWAIRHNLTAYDALYVVLARHIGAPFLTTDRKLGGAPSLGIELRLV